MVETTIRQAFRMSFFGLMLVLMALLVLSFSGSAKAATARAGINTVPTELIGVEIVMRHGKVVYSSARLNLKVNQHFNSSNDTNITQTETYMGRPLVNIPPHQDIEAWWAQKGTYVLGLTSNPQTKLTIVVS